MSISLPSYRRREGPLLGRPQRLLAIVAGGLRREFRRPAVIIPTLIGTLVTTAISVVFLIFAPFLLRGEPLDLRFFFRPASNIVLFFFVPLMAAIVGGGLIADDLNSNALTLYLSRPITRADYLMAKAAVLAPLISMVAILPLVVTALAAPLLGLFPWNIALQALGISLAIGLLHTGFYTAMTLMLSCITARRGYAAAGVFGITFGLTITARLVYQAVGNPSAFYLSPWEDYLAVAGAAFGEGSSRLDWSVALAILLGAMALASLATYLRMKAAEVVAG